MSKSETNVNVPCGCQTLPEEQRTQIMDSVTRVISMTETNYTNLQLCKWCHQVVKFETNAKGAIWQLNLQLMQVVPSDGHICNQFMYRVVFFNCSHPKISKYKKKPKYTNCSHGNSSEMSKYGKSQNIVTVPHSQSGNSLNTLTFFFLCFFQGGNSSDFWSQFTYRLTLRNFWVGTVKKTTLYLGKKAELRKF